MKHCFKCGERKPLSAFYSHPEMADGHVNKCKECNKRDVRKNRKAKVNYYRAYDARRGNRQGYNYIEARRAQNPNMTKAHRMVQYHIRKGSLVPEDCEACGESNNIHAHHDDYSRPLNVRWLCAACHHEHHKIHGPGLNP